MMLSGGRGPPGRPKAAGIRPRPPQPWQDAENYQDSVEVLLLYPEHSGAWERRFLGSLMARSRRCTPRQIDVLTSVGEKVERCMRSSWATAA